MLPWSSCHIQCLPYTLHAFKVTCGKSNLECWIKFERPPSETIASLSVWFSFKMKEWKVTFCVCAKKMGTIIWQQVEKKIDTFHERSIDSCNWKCLKNDRWEFPSFAQVDNDFGKRTPQTLLHHVHCSILVCKTRAGAQVESSVHIPHSTNGRHEWAKIISGGKIKSNGRWDEDSDHAHDGFICKQNM